MEEKETCKNCAAFKPYATVGTPEVVRGECRVHSPVLVAVRGELHSGWPSVKANEWCGEFMRPWAGEVQET